MRIASLGHPIFAATLIGLGLWGLATGGFTPIWQPAPRSLPARETVAYACALVSLATGLGLLWRRRAALAARVLLAALLLWLAAVRGPAIAGAPLVEVSWEGLGESLVVVAGAWVLYAEVADGWDRRHLGFARGERGLRIARMLYGLALVPLGFAHLAYLKQTAALVPAWLPSREAWAAFTGVAYVAAGAAVVSGAWARLAATLSAVQMGLFTVLVWAPMLAAGSKDASAWSEALDSGALTAAGWVVAESYRRTGAGELSSRRRRTP